MFNKQARTKAISTLLIVAFFAGMIAPSRTTALIKLPNPPDDPPTVSPVDTTRDVPCSPGALVGQANVSCTGAGVYQIPIEVPPGTVGMQPELSLSYNSQGTGGLLGQGWGVNGLSTITRCPATIAMDGYKGAINFDGDDRFCLDGQRLIDIGATADGREYRLQPNDFTRIRSHGATPGHPFSFTIETKDGLIKEYGNTADSRIEAIDANGVTPWTRAWAINHLENRVGNYMNYSYSEDQVNGEFRISQIDYTGNTAAGLAPYNFVKFSYFNRSADTSKIYTGGTFTSMKSLLQSIKTCLSLTCTGTNLVKDYRLDYELGYATQRYHLKSVTECTSATLCLPPTKMTWSDSGQADLTGNTTSGVSGGTQWTQDAFGHETSPSKNDSYFKTRTPLYPDAFFPAISAVGNAQDARSMAIAGAILAVSTFAFVVNPVAGIVGWAIGGLITFFKWFLGSDYFVPKAKLADVNGDGRTDIVELPKDPEPINPNQTPDNAYVWLSKQLSNGQRMFERQTGWRTDNLTSLDPQRDIQADEAKMGDFNGDGLMDIMTFAESVQGTVYVRASNGSTAFDPGSPQMQANSLGDIDRVSLGDFNGDGRMDAAQFDSNGHIYLNNPTTNQLEVQPSWGDCTIIGLACGSDDHPLENVVMGDVNGDGKTDIVVLDYSDLNNVVAKIWLTNKTATGWSAASPINYTFPFRIDPTTDDTHPAPDMIMPGDFNGDGKMDLSVWLAMPGKNFDQPYDTKDASFNVFLSTGSTFTPSSGFTETFGSTNAPYAFKYPDNGFTNVTKLSFLARLSDFNGDGKTDIIVFDTRANAHMFLSDGNQMRKFLKGSFSVDSYDWGGGFGAIDQVMLGDFDGDGRTDVAQFPGAGFAGQVHATLSNKIAYPDLMTAVTDGFTKTDSFTYKPLSDDTVYTGHTSLSGFDNETYNFRGAVYVVSRLATSNGQGGNFNLDYTYAGAKIHRSYGFMGFASITVTDNQRMVVQVDEYEQKFPLNCRKKSETISTISLRDLSKKGKSPALSGAAVALSTKTFTWTTVVTNSVSPTSPVALRLTTETNVQREPNNVLISNTAIDYLYDSFGNITNKTTRWPDVAFTYETDANTYVNNASTWVLGLSDTVSVTRNAPNAVPARVTDYNYNPVNRLLNSTIENFQGAKTRTSTFTHDAFGNATQLTLTGTDIATRSDNTTYDTLGRLPTSFTNALSQTTNLSFSPRHGQALSSTDPNNLTTTWTFNAYDRLQSTANPNGVTETLEYCSQAVPGTVPPNTVSWVQTTTTGQPTTIRFIDARQRELRNTKYGFNWIVWQDSTYDPALHLAERTEPYYQGQPSVKTTYTYDQRDQVISQTDPNGRVASTTFTTAPSLVHPSIVAFGSGLLWHKSVRQETSTLATGVTTVLRTETITNRLNQVQEVVKRDGSNAIVSSITYDYDAYNNPVRQADAEGNITYRQYIDDLLTQNNDLDLGYTTNTFDVLGQKKTSIDNSNPTVTYTYDLLGRMTNRTEPEGGSSTWTYDAGPKAIGQLTGQTSPNGFSESYGFDSLGRASTVTTTIPGDSTTFTTTTAYDTASRPLSVTYPDGTFSTSFDYLPQGWMSNVKNTATGQSIWQPTSVDAAGLPVKTVDGNGLGSSFTYDAVHMPATITIGDTLNNAAQTPYKKINYTYNQQSDVLQHRDDTLMPNSETEENLTYDASHRLVNQFAFTNDIQHSVGIPRSSEDYTYSDSGNITLKSNIGPDISYPAANNPQVHAPSGACDDSACYLYNYDGNGNQTSGRDLHNDTTRNISWFSFNKPNVVTEGSKTLTMKYDSARDKVKQVAVVSGNTTTTEYIGRYYEKVTRPDGVVENRHYVYGYSDQPVAVYISRSDNSTQWLYLHQDRLGSPLLVTDQSGQIAEELSFDPYGNRRQVNYALPTGPITSMINRGFAGHEQLDDFGLIDMGGRMYDPNLGRFISADPYMTDAYEPENANRYSYVYNTPASLVDPSGYGVFSFYEIFASAGVAACPSFAAHAGATILTNAALSTGLQLTARTGIYVTTTENTHMLAGSGPTTPTGPNNMYGYYVGPDNPTKPNGDDDYDPTPIDLVDLVGYAHDKAYDDYKAKGASDAFLDLHLIGIDFFLIFQLDLLLNSGTLGVKATAGAMVAKALFETILTTKLIRAAWLYSPQKIRYLMKDGFMKASQHYYNRMGEVLHQAR